MRGIGAAVPGLDVDRWLADAKSDRVAQAVQNDFEQGQAAGIQGTPTFFLVADGQTAPPIPSSLSVGPFREGRDAALAR